MRGLESRRDLHAAVSVYGGRDHPDHCGVGVTNLQHCRYGRKYGIKEATLYRWRAKYKGMGKSEAQRLKVLEDENRQLKRLVADKELIIQTLNDILKKNF